MSNSTLFKQAHRMTKLTIQPNETYRYKFGQWLIFLKTGITNTLGFTNINQSVSYVPILPHDSEYHNRVISTSYSIEFPLTLVKTNKGTIGDSKHYWYINKYIMNFIGDLLSNPLLTILLCAILTYTNIYL